MISVFILTDVRIYREGLTLALDRHESVEIVGGARTIQDARKRVGQCRPDIVLLDMLMRDSAEAVAAFNDLQPMPKIVALSIAEEDDEIVSCTELGVNGLVHRNATLSELITTLNCAMQDEFWCSPRAAAAIARRVANMGTAIPVVPTKQSITRRELQIVRLVDEGLSNKEIARHLNIELATVKNHVHNILEKLCVHSRGEAAARLRNAGMIPGLNRPVHGFPQTVDRK